VSEKFPHETSHWPKIKTLKVTRQSSNQLSKIIQRLEQLHVSEICVRVNQD